MSEPKTKMLIGLGLVVLLLVVVYGQDIYQKCQQIFISTNVLSMMADSDAGEKTVAAADDQAQSPQPEMTGGGGPSLSGGGYGLGKWNKKNNSRKSGAVAPTLFPSLARHQKFVAERPSLRAGAEEGFNVRSNYPQLVKRLAAGQTDREQISDRTGLAKRIGIIDDPRNDFEEYWNMRNKQICEDSKCSDVIFGAGVDLYDKMSNCKA